MRIRSLAVLAVLGTSACTDSTGPVEQGPGFASRIPQALTVDNGTNLNGTNLNGTNLNGTDLSGFLVGTRYLPARLDGIGDSSLEAMWLEGSTFVGLKNGKQYRGMDFINAAMFGELGDGSQVRLRISGIQAAAAPNEDLSLYAVEYRRPSDGAWLPVCRDSSGAAALALPVQGTWDYRQGVAGGGSHTADPERFTFACVGAAIAKCALWGYRPWASYHGVPLAPFHQACTRLVRADYCGDGSAYTQNGSRINFYDSLGIQRDSENWIFEAEWDENGARCFYALNRSRAGIPCYDARVDQLCGQTQLEPERGVLLRNETPGDGLPLTPDGQLGALSP